MTLTPYLERVVEEFAGLRRDRTAPHPRRGHGDRLGPGGL